MARRFTWWGWGLGFLIAGITVASCQSGGAGKTGGLTGFACVETGTPNWPALVMQFFIDHPKP